MSANASQLLEDDELHLFSWAASDAEAGRLKSLLQRLTRSLKRQVLFMTNHHGQNVLHIAAENGAGGNLQLLVDAVQELRCDEKLDGKCKNGMTPLHYAAKAHQTACVKILVLAGANVNSLNVARNTPLHLAALNFPAYYLPSLNARSYSTIQYLASQPDTNLATLNMDGKTPLSISPNYWVQHIQWDHKLRGKLEELRQQIARTKELVTEWKYLCYNKPIQRLTEITCPCLAGFDTFVDCTLLTGCFYDDDCAQNIVTVKLIDADNDAHMRELAVLNQLRGELSETSKRLVNINLDNTTGTVEYVVFPYIALDLHSFLHGRSEVIVKLAYQAVCAVTAVHSARVMHGDLKPHNFAVRVLQHGHFRVVLGNFDYAVIVGERKHHQQSTQGQNTAAFYPTATEYLRYDHPWVSPEVFNMRNREDIGGKSSTNSKQGTKGGGQLGTVLAERNDRLPASLAIDVFALGLILGVVVDNACCADRGRCLYERRDAERVLGSQLALTGLFRTARCRPDPLAQKLLVCATNMMCLIDPLQRCAMDDILREIDL